MKKFAAPAVAAVLCALSLMSPAAGLHSGPRTDQQTAPAPARAGDAPDPRDAASGPTVATPPDDDGGPAAADTPGANPVAPAVEPEIAAASPAAEQDMPLSVADTSPAAPAEPVAGPTDAVAPEPPSVPPLWGPAELSDATGPTAPPESVTTEALIPDDNSAAVLTVFNEINKYRAANGLAAVKYHATVAGMAQEWSNNIATREVIEHRASFWTDPRAMNPNSAGEVIAVRWDRDAAKLVEWWKSSPGHNAMLLDPRFNVMGAGITYTDGNWQTTPNRYTLWGVVNFFGYNTLPAGTTTSPGGSPTSGNAFPPAPPTMCDAAVKHMPPTLDLRSASITSAADLVSINAAGQVVNRPSTGNRTFGAAKLIGFEFGAAKEVFITDWDRDGAFDLLTQWTSGTLTLHRGIATGGFHGSVMLGQSGWSGMTLAVGGWCANNRMPQIVALDTAGNLWLYPNMGLADLSSRTLMASNVWAGRLAMVDYDADGFQDLLAIKGDGVVQLYRGAGTPAPRAEARPNVAVGWQDVSGIRPLRNVTALNSTGVALRRANDVVQYWDLSGGSLAAPSNVTGSWSGQRLAQ